MAPSGYTSASFGSVWLPADRERQGGQAHMYTIKTRLFVWKLWSKTCFYDFSGCCSVTRARRSPGRCYGNHLSSAPVLIRHRSGRAAVWWKGGGVISWPLNRGLELWPCPRQYCDSGSHVALRPREEEYRPILNWWRAVKRLKLDRVLCKGSNHGLNINV